MKRAHPSSRSARTFLLAALALSLPGCSATTLAGIGNPYRVRRTEDEFTGHEYVLMQNNILTAGAGLFSGVVGARFPEIQPQGWRPEPPGLRQLRCGRLALHLARRVAPLPGRRTDVQPLFRRWERRGPGCGPGSQDPRNGDVRSPGRAATSVGRGSAGEGPGLRLGRIHRAGIQRRHLPAAPRVHWDVGGSCLRRQVIVRPSPPRQRPAGACLWSVPAGEAPRSLGADPFLFFAGPAA